MKVFLNGGGADIQTIDAYKRLNQIIDNSKPCLYIPLAMTQEKYDSCYEWIAGELKSVAVPKIDMTRSAEELSTKNLNDYSFLFIGGGNTFKLLHDLKKYGAFEKISEYINNDGIVFGGSAGAIIFGKDLEACKLVDENKVNLQDINGFDILNGISILCHYTSGTPEKDAENKEYLLELSKHRTSIALPEEITLFVNDNDIEAIGNKPYYLFDKGNMLPKCRIGHWNNAQKG